MKRTQINLKNVDPAKVFYDFIYPLFAREFIFCSSFIEFLNYVDNAFLLTPEQIKCIKMDWEVKETLLSA